MALIEERKALERLSLAWRQLMIQAKSGGTLPPQPPASEAVAAELRRLAAGPTNTQPPP